MLVAIGPDKFVFQKNDRQFSHKDFPRGQVNGFADNLDFEKLKRNSQKSQPTLRILKRLCFDLTRAFGTCHSRANPPRHQSYGKSQIKREMFQD